MESKFLDISKFKTRYAAKKQAPWAAKIARVYMGWIAFETIDQYHEFKEDMKKERLYRKQQFLKH